MKKASISQTKNSLSRLIEGVKAGDTVLILDRGRPVARLEPVNGGDMEESEWIASLMSRGLVSPPTQELDVEAFLRRKKVKPAAGASAVRLLVEERSQGR